MAETMTIEKINELTDPEKIKLYIARYNTAKNEETRTRNKSTRKNGTKKNETKKKTPVSYEVVLSSGLDAIIERIDNNGIKQLVIMPSQDKYLFKENEVVQDINYEDLKIFFSHIPKEGIHVNNIVFSTIYNASLGYLCDMINSERKALAAGMMSLDLYLNSDKLIRDLKNNKIDEKLWKMIVTKTPILKTQNKYSYTFVSLAIEFYKYRGYDAARMFVENYTQSSMRDVMSSGYLSHLKTSKQYQFVAAKELDTKRLIQYLCFDLYSQGFDYIPCTDYQDYLTMSAAYDGKIKDKYPEALLTAHDIMSMKYSFHKQEIDEKQFIKNYDCLKKELSSIIEVDPGKKEIFKHKNMVMMIPGKTQDLIDEGQALGHCVGSYIERVVSGQCMILFARLESALETPYLTVEIKPINNFGEIGYTISQIQGDMKRVKLTEVEKDFFKLFANKTGFSIENNNF